MSAGPGPLQVVILTLHTTYPGFCRLEGPGAPRAGLSLRHPPGVPTPLASLEKEAPLHVCFISVCPDIAELGGECLGPLS